MPPITGKPEQQRLVSLISIITRQRSACVSVRTILRTCQL